MKSRLLFINVSLVLRLENNIEYCDNPRLAEVGFRLVTALQSQYPSTFGYIRKARGRTDLGFRSTPVLTH